MVEPHAAPDTGVKTYVAHLHPSDCSNLISAMKAIVMGFVDKFHEDGDDSDEEDLRKSLNTPLSIAS